MHIARRDLVAALAHGAGDHGFADRGDIQADALLEQAGETIAHAAPSSVPGNSSARTLSGSRSATLISCSRPSGSSSTGPR
ncbi:hypothetical protein D3C80_1639770 [compost metagenome]